LTLGASWIPTTPRVSSSSRSAPPCMCASDQQSGQRRASSGHRLSVVAITSSSVPRAAEPALPCMCGCDQQWTSPARVQKRLACVMPQTPPCPVPHKSSDSMLRGTATNVITFSRNDCVAHPSRATLPRCALLSPTRVSSVKNSPLAVFPYTSRWRIPMMLTPLLSPTTSSRHVGIEFTPQVRCDARNGRARGLCIPSHDPTAGPRWQVTRMPLTLMARIHALSPVAHAAHPHVAHSHLSR
jgi:hypothetical protein